MPTAIDTIDGQSAGIASGTKQWPVLFLPSLTDLIFLLPLFLLYGILPGSKLLLGDADMGWHIRTGEWILQHHAVPVTDLFSYTRPDAPWFAWEWGWDICFATIHHWAGLPGIVVVNAAILSVVAVLTFRLARRASGNDLVSFVLTGIAMCGSTLHWLARPHLVSWLFFLTFAHLIWRAADGRSRVLWVLPPLAMIWTNVHGSFFFAVVMPLIAAMGPWVDWAIHGGEAGAVWKRSRAFIAAAAGCALATFCNPYGWRLHEHVLRYLGDSKQLDIMQEFQSMNFHHAPAAFFECMLLLGGASLLWCIRKRRWDGFLTVLLWAHLGLFSVRNIPMYLFLATPWIACMLDEALRSENRAASWVMLRFRQVANEFQPIERMERLYLVAGAGLAFVACNVLAGSGCFDARFDPKVFPESAVALIDQYKPAHVFARDQWSAYLLYRRFPAIRVFIDDRSDFYGADLLDRTANTLNARWDWEANILQVSTDMVIVAPDMPLATVLKGSPRWQLLLDDQRVVVFRRRALSSGLRVNPPSLTPAGKSSAVANNGGSTLGV